MTTAGRMHLAQYRPLGLDNSSFLVSATANTVIGNIVNYKSASSTFSFTPVVAADIGKIKVVGSQLLVDAGQATPWMIPGLLTETPASGAPSSRYIVVTANIAYTLPTPVLLESFDVDTGFTVGGTGATKSLDTSNKIQGTGSMLLTGPTGSTTTMALTKQVSAAVVPATLGTIAFARKRQSTSPTFASSINLSIKCGGTTQLGGIGPHEGNYLDGWRWISASIKEYTNLVGLGSGLLQLSMQAPTAGTGPAIFNFDAAYQNADGRPTVVMTFDDGYPSIFTTALPLMQARGFVGSCYYAPGLVDTPGYITTAQMRALFQAGWDICCDGSWDDSSMLAVDVPTAVANLNRVRAWVIANGFARNGSENHFCYPFGATSPALAAACSAAGFLTGRLAANGSDSFHTRFGLGGQNLAMPCQQVSNSVTPATMASLIDKVVQRGSTQFVLDHSVDDNNTSLSYSIANFTDVLDYWKTLSDAGNLDVRSTTQVWNRDGRNGPP